MYAMTRIASDHYCHLAGDEALQDCPNPKSLTAMSCWFGPYGRFKNSVTKVLDLN